MDDGEYHLDDPNEELYEEELSEKKPSNKNKIIIIISIIVISIIIIGLIIFLVVLRANKKNENKEEEKSDHYIYKNLTYAVNQKIINTFKETGEHYNEILGNINNGNDYDESDRNNFDICIPYNITKRKNKYNRIILYIHGGGWWAGHKMNISEICPRYEKYGFISSSLGYTLLRVYNNTNMFRIIDEITHTINAIKDFLKGKGFDENKLELVLGGGSAGGHLAMLYSYMIKNPSIPIKFVYDNVGPVNIEPKYFWYTRVYNESLDNIEPEDIERAKSENKLKSLDETPYAFAAKLAFLNQMNLGVGRHINESYDKIFTNLTNGTIIENSTEYKNLTNTAKYAFPLIYINKETIPTICVYGGQDEYNGVEQYSLLKKKFVEEGNYNIELVYYKYGPHEVENVTGEAYNKAVIREEGVFYNYTQKYLTQDNN